MPLLKILKLVLVLLCVSSSLSACRSTRQPASTASNPASLSQLENLKYNTQNPYQINHIRIEALRDTALSLGARGGLHTKANHINAVLQKHEPLLSRLFNFNALMLNQNVLPPVLVEGRDTLDIAGSDAIRIADRQYQILAQAHFVTTPPTFRQYLWMDFPAPETPDASLLPKTREEKALWRQFIQKGWQAGLEQGDRIFQENLGRLKRDYEGMLRYRRLLAENKVSPPFVAETDLGVTGDSQHITINDRVLRITAFPALQLDPDKWKTEIISHDKCPPHPR